MAAKQAPQANSPESSLFFQRLESLAHRSHSGRSKSGRSKSGRARSDGAASTRLSNLYNATRELLAGAEAISKQVTRFLPQFTLHDGKHLWNVLTFMEQLAGGTKGVNKLEAGDCAMAIWAAFIHDLGMVLEAEELHALDAADHYDVSSERHGRPPSNWSEDRVQAWRAYRDGNEHWNSIRETFGRSQASPRDIGHARMRLGIIRAAFIRDSHARDHSHSRHCRIADWLKCLAGASKLIEQALTDYSIETQIVRVAVSHNQLIDWLPSQLKGRNPHAENLGAELGVVHWTWIGWLLRLADVFDCDASRTPRVWFDHGGITDRVSKTEWRKHLAIPEPPQWNEQPDGQTLLYTCQKCPSPIVEKALRSIVGWMNDEIKKVHSARLEAPDRGKLPPLHLPSGARVDIVEREGGYLYHDMEFHLDRDAVVELLMGESLYGGPELALRELVQNALDAVHLRDQRNRLAAAVLQSDSGEALRQPHQAWEQNEAPGVDVTWGYDASKRLSDGRTGCHYIRVRDNGVGMTVGTMRRFLTRIGKSYYKSDEFRAEQELMRRHGILCSAISQFGIGFLSVFMLADEVTIHTRPLGATHNGSQVEPSLQDTARFPFRAEIHGPHGLLTFYPDQSRETQRSGTTVTVWLKESYVIPDWDPELLKNRLRKEFYKQELAKSDAEKLEPQSQQLNSGAKLLDVGFEIGRFIVWPLYPVRLSCASQPEVVEINDTFHQQVLVPLDRDALRAKAREWNHEIPEIDRTDWRVCDWVDEFPTPNGGVDGTGTRVRLIGPHPERPPNGRSFHPKEWSELSELLESGEPRLLLGNFSEPQMPEPMTRYQCLVAGVRIVPGFVPSTEERDCQLRAIIERLPIMPGEGGWVWIDLRGSAMPRLRADRSAPTQSQPADSALADVWQRWQSQWTQGVRHWQLSQARSRQSWHAAKAPQSDVFRIGLPHISPMELGAFAVLEASVWLAVSWSLPSEWRKVARSSFVYNEFFSETIGITRFISSDYRARARVLARALDRDRDLDLDLARDLARDLAHALDTILVLDTNLVLDVNLDLAGALDIARDPDIDLDLMSTPRGGVLIGNVFCSHIASERIAPRLLDSHPATGFGPMDSSLQDVDLVGPVHLSRQASRNSPPDWLRMYDLIAPFTGFKTSTLQTKFRDWRKKLVSRRIYMLPFLFGEEPSHEWRERFRKNRPCDTLMLFMPNPDHWEWLFAEHSRDEWNQGSASALWDLTTGAVLYADGIHDEASLRTQGKPLREWLELG